MSDLVERLLEAIAEADEAAEQYPEDHSDPDGILRLCQAHREIVGLHSTRHEIVDGFCIGHFGDCADWSADDCQRCDMKPCETVRALAGGYGIQEEQ